MEVASSDESVLIYMTRADALKVADFLDSYGDDDDQEIAANIRFQAKWNNTVQSE